VDFLILNKEKMPSMSGEEIVVYVGRLIVPILLWLSVFAIMKGFLKRSAWSFEMRIALFFCLFFASLLFLLVVHVFTKTPEQTRMTNVRE